MSMLVLCGLDCYSAPGLFGAEIKSHRGKSLERGVQSGRKPATVAKLFWAS
jgi:hypothetical protein